MEIQNYIENILKKTAVGVFSQLTEENSERWIRKYINPRPFSDTTSSLSLNNSSELNDSPILLAYKKIFFN